MRCLLLSILCSLSLGGYTQSLNFGDGANIYLIRHGEKEAGTNPPLSATGHQRSGDLLRALKDKKLQRIYVTGYKRTQQTGDSLRIQLGIDTVVYEADTTGNDLVAKIQAHGDLNRPILVIGHSNTVPLLINKLGVSDHPVTNIPDEEFDNLFVITFKKSHPSLQALKYGKRSTAVK